MPDSSLSSHQSAFAIHDVATSSAMSDVSASSASHAPASNQTTLVPTSALIEKIFLPIVFVMGTICNIFVILVMRRKKMRHQSTYFYMCVLAIDDQLVLILGCLNYLLYLLDIVNAMKYPVVCKLVSFIAYTSLHFSVWIVVIMTVERFIAVALPLQASRLCTVKRAKTVSLVLVFILMCVNSHFLVTHAVEKGKEIAAGVFEYNCQYTDFFKPFYTDVWPWVDASIYSIGPFIILIIFNTLIVYNLVKASKSISKLNGASSIVSRCSDKLNNNNVNSNDARKISMVVVDSKKNSCDLKEYRFSSFVASVCCFCCLRIEYLRNKSRDDGAIRKSSHAFIAKMEHKKHPKISVDDDLPNNDEKPYKNSSGYENPKYKYKFKSNTNMNASSQSTTTTLSVSEPPRKTSLSGKESQRTNIRSNGQSNHLNSTSSSSSQSSSANRRLTIMLLVISAAFFVTSTPIVTLQMIDMRKAANMAKQSKSGNATEPEPEPEIMGAIRGTFLVLQYLNHSINFFLYAVTGKTFRREFIALFRAFRSGEKRKNSLKNSNVSFASKRGGLTTSLSNNNMVHSPSGHNLNVAAAAVAANNKGYRKTNGSYLMVTNSSLEEDEANKTPPNRGSPAERRQDKPLLRQVKSK